MSEASQANQNVPINIGSLITKLHQNQNSETRLTASGELRRAFKDQRNFAKSWPKFSDSEKKAINDVLFNLESEANQDVLSDLSYCLGVLSCFEEQQEIQGKQSASTQRIIDHIITEDSNELEIGLNALAAHFSLKNQNFEKLQNQLCEIFELVFGNFKDNVPVIAAAARAYSEMIPVYDLTSHKKKFGEFSEIYISSLIFVLKKGDDQEIERTMKRSLEMAVNIDGQLAQVYFQKWFELIEKELLDESEGAIQRQYQMKLILFLTNMITEVEPQLLKADEKSQDYLKILLESIFQLMIEDEKLVPSKQWTECLEPADSFFEEAKEYSRTQFGMKTIVSLMVASKANEKKLQIYIFPTIDKYLASPSWNLQFAGIMIFSMLFEYFKPNEQEVDVNQQFSKEMVSRLDLIIKLVEDQNQHQLVLFAILHLLRIAAEDLAPIFYEFRGAQVLEICLKFFQSSNQRVLEQSISTLSRLIKDNQIFQSERKEKFAFITESLLDTLKNGKSALMVQETALTALATMASTIREAINPFTEQIAKNLFSLFDEFRGDEFKQIQNHFFQCISVLSVSCEKSIFLPFLDQFIDMLLFPKTFTKSDKQRIYLSRAWNCLFQDFLEEIKLKKNLVFEPMIGTASEILNELASTFILAMNRNKDEKQEFEKENPPSSNSANCCEQQTKNCCEKQSKNCSEKQSQNCCAENKCDEKQTENGKVNQGCCQDEDCDIDDQFVEDQNKFVYEFEEEEAVLFQQGIDAVELIGNIAETFPDVTAKYSDAIVNVITNPLSMLYQDFHLFFFSQNILPFLGLSQQVYDLDQFEDSEFKSSFLQVFPEILKCLKISSPERTQQLIKIFLKNFIQCNSVIEKTKFQCEIDKLDCIQNLLSLVGTPFLTVNQVQDYISKVTTEIYAISQQIVEIDKRLVNQDYQKEDCARTATENCCDENGICSYEAMNDETKIGAYIDLIFSLEDGFNKLITHHSSLISSQKDIQNLYNEILKIYQEFNQNEDILSVVLFFMDDLVAFVPYEVQQSKWPQFFTFFKMYATSKNVKIKQSSIYGLGLLFKNTPQNQVFQVDEVRGVLKLLSDAFSQQSPVKQGKQKLDPQEDEDLIQFLHAQDNAIASYGKVLFNFYQLLDEKEQITNFEEFLYLMPLQNDKEQGHILLQLFEKFIQSEIAFTQQNEHIFAQSMLTMLSVSLNNPETIEFEEHQGPLQTTQLVQALFKKSLQLIQLSSYSQISETLTKEEKPKVLDFLNQLESANNQQSD